MDVVHLQIHQQHPCTLQNMRPIQLLNAIRKLFSIIVYARIYDKLYPHIESGNFGFLRGRGREKQLWNYAWMLASASRHSNRFHVMGLELLIGQSFWRH